MLIRGFLVLLAVTLPVRIGGEKLDEYNIPDAVESCFERENLVDTHLISGRINPFYLRGDFDGDGEPDYAVLVEARVSTKKGIVICLNRSPRMHIVWAGSKAFDGLDDISFDAWKVFDKGAVDQGATEEPPPRLVGDAIYVVAEERWSGLIYWDGKKFAWYQQAD